jgi:haloalkane dehalogenase
MESSSTSYRTPDERFAALPGWDFAPRYVDQDGLRMHYVDEGSGEPVLLLHGEPTWSFLWRRVIPELTPHARAVAPDWFGFGRSDKPTERAWYSYDAHYASLERFVEQLDLRDVTLVVHDWGGPIGFRLAVTQPQRVARLVVLNTGILAGRAPNDVWLAFREMVRRVGTDIQPGRMLRAATVRPLADEVVAAYDAPFPTPESRAGVVAFPELVPTEREHPSFASMDEVAQALRKWDKPALVFFGDSDPIFPPEAAERVAAWLPNAELLPPVERAGHFVAEDDGEEVGRRIAAWLRA